LEVIAEVVKAFQWAIVQLHGNDDDSVIRKYRFSGAGRKLNICSFAGFLRSN